MVSVDSNDLISFQEPRELIYLKTTEVWTVSNVFQNYSQTVAQVCTNYTDHIKRCVAYAISACHKFQVYRLHMQISEFQVIVV